MGECYVGCGTPPRNVLAGYNIDMAVRSVENPSAFKENYNGGTHLHPSDTAYKVMWELAFRGIRK